MFSESPIMVHLAWHNLRRPKKVLCLLALLMFIFLLVCKHTFTENSVTRDHICSSPTSMRCTLPNANIPGRAKENKRIENDVPIITDKVIQDIEYISHKPSLCKHVGQRYAGINALSPVMTSLNCGKEELFYAESNIFRLNKTILKGQKLKQCTYRALVRTNDNMTTYKEPTTRTQKPFDIHVEDDFVRISCQLVEAGKTLNKSHKQQNKLQLRDFDQFLAMINPKPSVYARISRQLKQGLPGQRMNVLMLGFDSVSHLAFQRHLPHTYRYLKEILGSIILESYNVVGDGTTAQIIPMLTGKSQMELPDTRRTTNGSQYVDVYPLIWRDFWDNGYVTMFAEDFPKGTIFNFLLNGFDAPPTDHYMRPLWNAMWDSEVRQSSAKYCTGNTPHYKYLLDYMRDFNVKYRNVSKFAFLLGAELTHDDNSKGEYMDGDLVELLTFLHSGGYLEDTLLVVMSDHGARYNAARKTVQGKMEERLPMMSLRFPPWFKQRYPILNRNLVTNVDRLSTPYDIHETLLDVLNLGRIVNTVDQPDKSISLLRPIPWNRTCTDAGIEMHWCTCMEQSPLDTRNGEVTKAVETVLGFVNSKTRKLRKLCAELQIKTVLNALLLIPNEQLLKFRNSIDVDQMVPDFSANTKLDNRHIQVTMETQPGGGVFEGTVRVALATGSRVLLGDVSRLNRYGDQPRCVQHARPDLSKFCFCSESANKGDNSR